MVSYLSHCSTNGWSGATDNLLWGFMAGILASAMQELRAERAARGCNTDVFPG